METILKVLRGNNMDCSNVKKITDVTDQIDYNDTNGSGKGDAKWVSCGQDGSYNELQDKYNKYFSNINEALISSIMCKCCKKLKPTGKEKVTWLEFYKCMKGRLNLENYPKTIEKLNELIEYHKSRN